MVGYHPIENVRKLMEVWLVWAAAASDLGRTTSPSILNPANVPVTHPMKDDYFKKALETVGDPYTLIIDLSQRNGCGSSL